MLRFIRRFWNWINPPEAITELDIVIDKDNLIEAARRLMTLLQLPKQKQYDLKASCNVIINVHYRNAAAYYEQLETLVYAIEHNTDVTITQVDPKGEISYYDWLISDDQYYIDPILTLQETHKLWVRYYACWDKLVLSNSSKKFYYTNRATALLTDSIAVHQSIYRIFK